MNTGGKGGSRRTQRPPKPMSLIVAPTVDVPSPQEPFKATTVPEIARPKPQRIPLTPQGKDSSLSSSKSAFSRPGLMNSSQHFFSGSKQRLAPDRVNHELDQEFDDFFAMLSSSDPIALIEDFVKRQLKATTVIYWEEVSSIQRMISKRLHVTVKHDYGLLGYAFRQRSLTFITNAKEHPDYAAPIDGTLVNPNATLIFVPLWNDRNQLSGIIEIAKKHDDTRVTENNKVFLETFMRKFRGFSKWILEVQDVDEVILNFMQFRDTVQFMLNFHSRMHDIFNCRDSEIWHYDISKATMKKYHGDSSSDFTIGHLGVVDSIIQKAQMLNTASIKLESSYMPDIDGEEDEPVIGVPFAEKKHLIVLVLRGNKQDEIFTGGEERLLSKITPFLGSSFLTTLGTAGSDDTAQISEISDLLPKPRMKQSDQEVIDNLMTQLVKQTKATRGTLYIIEKENIVSLYQSGWKQQIVVPLGRGHAGICAAKGTIMNVVDAYDDDKFDQSVDATTGFRTTSLLTVPIFSTNGTVISVVQLMNKHEDKPFSTMDIDRCTVYGTFCSLLLDNASILKKFKDMNRRTDGFFNSVLSLLDTTDHDKCFKLLLKGARLLLRTDHVELYRLDIANKTLINMVDERKLDGSTGSAGYCISKKEGFYVNDTKRDAKTNGEHDYVNICMVPIMSRHDDEAIGIFKATDRYGGFDEHELMIMRLFSSLFGILISEMRFRKYMESGSCTITMEKVISEEEKSGFNIPKHLQCTEIRLKVIEEPTYDTLLYSDDLDLIKLIFYVFNNFGLCETFRISNERLFTFLFNINKGCSDTQYHNYIKAVDNMQFAVHMIKLANLRDVWRAEEILAIFLADLSLFLKHDGTNDRFQVETESRISLLYKTDPLQTAASAEMVRILSKPTCNLLENISDRVFVLRWTIDFISLAKPDAINTLIFDINNIRMRSTVDMNNMSHRQLTMKILFIASCLSQLARPLAVCEKWFKLQREELFTLGDMEVERKLILSTQFNSRDLFIAGQFEQAVMDDYGKPVFEALVSMLPTLNPLKEAVTRNHMHYEDLIRHSKAAFRN